MAKIDPKTGSRSPQDCPKTASTRIKKDIVLTLHFIIVFGSSWAPSWRPFGPSCGLRVSSWGRLGAPLAPQDGPKTDPSSGCKTRIDRLGPSIAPKTPQDRTRWPKEAPKRPQEAQKQTPNHPQDPQEHPKKHPKVSNEEQAKTQKQILG